MATLDRNFKLDIISKPDQHWDLMILAGQRFLMSMGNMTSAISQAWMPSNRERTPPV